MNFIQRADWTKAATDLLADLWSQGLSASLIADQLGVSRNAVIGKVHRLSLGKRREAYGPPRRRVPTLRRFSVPKPRSPRPGDPEFIGPVQPSDWCGNPVDLVDLEKHHCRWVYGDPKDMKMCGDERTGESPFCERHHRIAYRPVGQRKAA